MLIDGVDLRSLSPTMLRQLRDSVGDVAREKIDAELAAPRTVTVQGTCAPIPVVRLERPVRFTVPFDVLVSDNALGGIFGEVKKEQRRHFQECKARFRRAARDAYDGEPVTTPVQVTVTVWYPDDVVRDGPNFWKLIGDGLKELVIADDRWQILRAANIEAGGIDRDNPRAEVEIMAIETKGAAA